MQDLISFLATVLPENGSFLPLRVSDLFHTEADVAAWMKAQGFIAIIPASTSTSTRCRGTINGLEYTVAVNGYVARW